MIETRLPRLLGPDMAEKARLRPSKATATVNLSPLSKASLTLPEGEPTVNVHYFMEVYGPDGSLGIFRAASVQTTYGNQQQVNLEHGLVTLEDDIIDQETVISGGMRSVLETLLGFQSKTYWTLGSVEATENVPETDVTMMGLLEAVLAVVGSDEGAMLAFDQTVFPWVMHVRRKPTVPACECRLNRNLNSVNIRLDDSSLCTRVTAEDIEGKRYTYTADTAATWGVVHRTITLDEGDDPETVARKYLDENKNPTVSIELDALELARRTGDALDRFTIGTVCRTALPEWGVAVDERIVAISYPDLFGQPEQVKITLSNGRRDASTQLSSNAQSIIQNTRGIAQNLKYYHELDNKAVIMAEQIELRATKDELGKYLNEVWITLDSHDASITLHAQQIEKAAHDISEAEIKISGAEASIDLVGRKADQLTEAMNEANLRIDGANAAITAQAQVVDEHGKQISAANLRIDGIAAEIELKVSKDGLISAINLSPETIRIASSKVVLDGYVTISEMEAEIARIDRLLSGNAHISYLDVGTGYFDYINCQGSMAFLGTFIGWKEATVLTGGSINVELDVGIGRMYAYLTDSITTRSQFSYVNTVSVKSATFNRTTSTLSYLGSQ